jgi:hypothetical protein
MSNDRTYVAQRLAEIHEAARRTPPPMSYWKALHAAARSEERREARRKYSESA